MYLNLDVSKRKVIIAEGGEEHIYTDLSKKQIKKIRKLAHKLENPSLRDFLPVLDPKGFLTFDLLNSDLPAGMIKVGNQVFYEGIPVPMPILLASEMVTHSDNPVLFDAYVNFWMKCSLNPDPLAREDLFPFLENYGFVITDHGCFVAYRRVAIEKRPIDKELAKTVSAEYLWARKARKNLDNYFIVYDASRKKNKYYRITATAKANGKYEGNIVGGLRELHHSDSAPVFTDNWTRSMEIRFGVPVKKNRAECDPDPEVECSSGLHVAGARWLENNRASFGEKGIIVLVDPRNVVAVPRRSGYGKMRTCEYYPYAEAQFDENGKIVQLEEITDEPYNKMNVEDLKKLLSKADVRALEGKEHNIGNIASVGFQSIMEHMKDTVQKRHSYVVD